MSIVICPGIHSLDLTQSFLAWLQRELALGAQTETRVIFSRKDAPAYSAWHILQFLRSELLSPIETPLVFISFSAGVVGAIGAAWGWQMLGGQVKAFIALDGWGVSLFGNFPIHRLSHDYFTHWSSSLLGSGLDSFYADPPVEHLELWRSPQTVEGWHILQPGVGTQPRSRLTAAQFLTMLLERYGEI